MTSSTAPLNVLFLCTGYSARSLIAEGLLRQMDGDGFGVFTAGSSPTGIANPHAIAVLRQHAIDTSFARSKRWDEFCGADATQIDLIVTVCDSAANEICPIWPGHPPTPHWGLPDPATVDGNKNDIDEAFSYTYAGLKRLITHLLDQFPDASNIGGLAQQLCSSEDNS